MSVIKIGMATCGRAAGGVDVYKAFEEEIKKSGLPVNIGSTGCIGLCSSEPIMDVQMPGMNRLSFENVTEDKVEQILEQIFKLELPEAEILGQFMFEKTRAWENVDDILNHPFFKPQNLEACRFSDL